MQLHWQKTGNQIWTPKLPQKVYLSHDLVLTDVGVTSETFKAFFAQEKTSSYKGFKWEMIDNNVYIYDTVDSPHELAIGTVDHTHLNVANHGGWGRLRRDSLLRSSRLANPGSNKSDWETDSSYLPVLSTGPVGSSDKHLPYPTLVLEVAKS